MLIILYKIASIKSDLGRKYVGGAEKGRKRKAEQIVVKHTEEHKTHNCLKTQKKAIGVLSTSTKQVTYS